MHHPTPETSKQLPKSASVAICFNFMAHQTLSFGELKNLAKADASEHRASFRQGAEELGTCSLSQVRAQYFDNSRTPILELVKVRQHLPLVKHCFCF